MSKKIEKSIEINASKEKVWDILLQEEYTKIWYAEFSEGSHAETDWKVGSKVVFTDHSGNGIFGKIIINKPYEIISVAYEGIVAAGVEDSQSEEAKGVKGWQETYRLTANAAVTKVSIECDMAPEHFESMSLAWDRALEKVKELSETNKVAAQSKGGLGA